MAFSDQNKISKKITRQGSVRLPDADFFWIIPCTLVFSSWLVLASFVLSFCYLPGISTVTRCKLFARCKTYCIIYATVLDLNLLRINEIIKDSVGTASFFGLWISLSCLYLWILNNTHNLRNLASVILEILRFIFHFVILICYCLTIYICW